MLLKPLVVAAGALLTVSIVSAAPASAAGYRGRTVAAVQYNRTARAGSARAGYARARYARAGYARQGYARAAYGRPVYTYAGYVRAGVARTYAPRTYTRYAATPAFRTRRIGLVRGLSTYRTVAHSRFARRVAVARRDQLIRKAVAPASSFLPAVTPAVGGGQVGQASYYALSSRTANGGRVGAATCAHRYLPFGTRILVTNLANAHQMVLTVNDRGPFTGGRILDVSKSAAGYLGMLGSGTAPVRLQVLGHS